MTHSYQFASINHQIWTRDQSTYLPTLNVWSHCTDMLTFYFRYLFSRGHVDSVLEQGHIVFGLLTSDSKNGYTFATVYNSKYVSVFLHQTIDN